MFNKRCLNTRMIFIVLMLLQVGVYAQVKTITGTVKDDKGAPLAKATVAAKGTKEKVTTKADGSFSINVSDTTTVLTISFAEFESKEISIKGTNNITVQLNPIAKKLEEVVVNIGYGTQKVKDVTGAVSSVKGSAIKDLPTQNVADALQGRVAGVDVTQS